MSDWKSHEAHELYLYAISDGDLYRKSAVPIIASLRKKTAKGTYSAALAAKMWGYHAERAARAYLREHGSPGDVYHRIFPASARREAAEEFELYYREAVFGSPSRDRSRRQARSRRRR